MFQKSVLASLWLAMVVWMVPGGCPLTPEEQDQLNRIESNVDVTRDERRAIVNEIADAVDDRVDDSPGSATAIAEVHGDGSSADAEAVVGGDNHGNTSGSNKPDPAPEVKPLKFVDLQILVGGQSWDPANPLEGQTGAWSFDATGGYTGGVGPYIVHWLGPDGSLWHTGNKFTRDFTEAGTFEITIKITDSQGKFITRVIIIVVKVKDPDPTPLTAEIIAPAPGSTFRVGQTVTFTARASGGSGNYRYRWQLPKFPVAAIVETTNTSVEHTFNAPGGNAQEPLIVTLEVTDQEDPERQARVSINLRVTE